MYVASVFSEYSVKAEVALFKHNLFEQVKKILTN